MVGQTNRRSRRWWLLVVCAALVASLISIPEPASAAPRFLHVQAPATAQVDTADDVLDQVIPGLEYAATATYRAEPELGEVHVSVTIDVRNVKPNTTSGYYTTRYYFPGVGYALPTGAEDVVATSNGSPLALEFDEADEFFQFVNIDFPRNLFYGQRRTIELGYVLRSEGPRSGGDVVVNAAHVSFPAFSFGDHEATTVILSFPAGFEVDLLGDWVDPVIEEGRTVYRFEDIPDPLRWFNYVSGERLAGLVDVEVDADEFPVTVRAWPDDPQWRAFVVDNVAIALETLESLTGLERPDLDELEVRESAAPYLYGYAGWYSADDGLIEVGDELDHHVLVHELGHIWFNDALFRERWITEGLANEYASLVLEEMEIDTDWDIDPVQKYDPGAVALNVWETPFVVDEDSEAREAWGYNAAWWVFRRLREEIGTEAMAEVLDAVVDGTVAYAGEDAGEVETTSRSRDWRRFLDLLEEVGGSEEAVPLFELYVLTPNQVSNVERREASRARYAELQEQGDGWAVPDGIRDAMERWRFPSADRLMDEAATILDARHDVATREADLGLGGGDDLEVAYEASVDDFGEAQRVADERLAAMAVVAEVRADVADDRGLIEQVGLWGQAPERDLEAVDAAYEGRDFDAVADHAAAIHALLDDAERVGTTRAVKAGGGVAGFVLLLALVVWRRRRCRRRADRDDDPADELSVPDDARALEDELAVP